jgi:hypothetical protein
MTPPEIIDNPSLGERITNSEPEPDQDLASCTCCEADPGLLGRKFQVVRVPMTQRMRALEGLKDAREEGDRRCMRR